MVCVAILFGLQRKWKWEIVWILQFKTENPEARIRLRKFLPAGPSRRRIKQPSFIQGVIRMRKHR
jgi:hypothetical protein